MTAALAFKPGFLDIWNFGGTGVGDAARYVRVQVEKARQHGESTETHRVPVAAHLLKEISDIWVECSKPNWDGYGAFPVNPNAISEAIDFAKLVPSWLPQPEVAAEPDGAIGFEWNAGNDRVFVASVSGNGIIVYAGLLGPGNKAHGTTVFGGRTPNDIFQFVSRVFS